MPDVRTRLRELLPTDMLGAFSAVDLESAEEIRLRLGFRPGILTGGRERSRGARAVEERDIAYVLDRASRSSLHAVSRELAAGYIQAGQGIRLGICGVYAEGGQGSMREISSLALRIPHELRGIGAEAIERLRPFDRSVLIISPPGGGKTSFLRELIRCASESGRRISVCDERGELAALWRGRSSFDLGPHTDVLSGREKSEGIINLLRSMNPEIIALDEISAERDGTAMEQAVSCGACIYATAHGLSVEALSKREHYRHMFEQKLFQKAVIISGRDKREYEVVELGC